MATIKCYINIRHHNFDEEDFYIFLDKGSREAALYRDCIKKHSPSLAQKLVNILSGDGFYVIDDPTELVTFGDARRWIREYGPLRGPSGALGYRQCYDN